MKDSTHKSSLLSKDGVSLILPFIVIKSSA